MHFQRVVCVTLIITAPLASAHSQLRLSGSAMASLITAAEVSSQAAAHQGDRLPEKEPADVELPNLIRVCSPSCVELRLNLVNYEVYPKDPRDYGYTAFYFAADEVILVGYRGILKGTISSEGNSLDNCRLVNSGKPTIPCQMSWPGRMIVMKDGHGANEVCNIVGYQTVFDDPAHSDRPYVICPSDLQAARHADDEQQLAARPAQATQKNPRRCGKRSWIVHKCLCWALAR
jgi:hypothetical protein